MSPTLSVLLPVREWRNTTKLAVESLLDQTFEDFELLLIGNADVEEIVQRLPSDKRIKALTRDGSGIVSALNTGLGESQGAFIARMDDDDIAYPERFDSQLRYLKAHPDIGLCGTLIRFVDEQGSTESIGKGNQRYASWLNSLTTPADISNACFIECPLPHPSWMAPRATFEKLKGYRQFDGPEDYDFVLRAWLADIRMGKPDDVLLDWRVHDSRLTFRDSRYRREAFTRCRARALCDEGSGRQLVNQRGIWICGTGRNARYWFDALIAEGCDVLGFVDLDRAGARQRKRHRPVITYETLWACREDNLVVTAITDSEARQNLIDTFESHGWLANKDFVIGG